MSWSNSIALVVLAAAAPGCLEGDEPDAATRTAEIALTATAPPALTPVPGAAIADHARKPNISGVAFTSAFGGTGADIGNAVAADTAGNGYVAGTTALCTTNPVFVEKVSAAGALTYAICLTTGTSAGGIAADSGGNAYVVVGSSLFKINPTGTALVYSVSLAPWQLTGVAVDASGNAYVTGRVTGTGTGNDVVVGKINAAGTVLVYGVSFGGSADDMANGIAVDGSGNAIVAGTTTSSNFLLVSPSQATLRGGQDAFVSKVNATGTALVYSTYLGGNQLDYGFGVAVDNAGNAYVGGLTSSIDGVESFPTTAGAAQSSPAGGGDAYVAKFNASGGKVYATYVGGSSGDVGNAIAVDRTTGAAVLTGNTQSTNFPTVSPVTSYGGGIADGFAVQLNPAGSAYSFARYLGGTSTDVGLGAASDSTGHVYLTGETFSPVFSPGGVATHGDFDAYLIKLNP